MRKKLKQDKKWGRNREKHLDEMHGWLREVDITALLPDLLLTRARQVYKFSWP